LVFRSIGEDDEIVPMWAENLVTGDSFVRNATEWIVVAHGGPSAVPDRGARMILRPKNEIEREA
jgi:hypothetical protein